MFDILFTVCFHLNVVTLFIGSPEMNNNVLQSCRALKTPVFVSSNLDSLGFSHLNRTLRALLPLVWIDSRALSGMHDALLPRLQGLPKHESFMSKFKHWS
jgi:hypothetical protein